MTPPGRPLLAYTVPAGWVAIEVPRSRSEAAEAAGAITTAYPGLADSRAGVERMIAGLTRACAVLDVLDVHATVLDALGGPLPVTLVASARPLGTQTLDALARGLADGGGQAWPPQVRIVDLPGGRAVRAEWLREQHASSPDQLVIQYLVEIAGARAVCVLTFATPAAVLAERLRPVFHQIAGSVRCDAAAIPVGDENTEQVR